MVATRMQRLSALERHGRHENAEIVSPWYDMVAK